MQESTYIKCLSVVFPRCVCNGLKIRGFSVKTLLYFLTNQLHVSATVFSHYQADASYIKRDERIQLLYLLKTCSFVSLQMKRRFLAIRLQTLVKITFANTRIYNGYLRPIYQLHYFRHLYSWDRPDDDY